MKAQQTCQDIRNRISGLNPWLFQPLRAVYGGRAVDVCHRYGQPGDISCGFTYADGRYGTARETEIVYANPALRRPYEQVR